MKCSSSSRKRAEARTTRTGSGGRALALPARAPARAQAGALVRMVVFGLNSVRRARLARDLLHDGHGTLEEPTCVVWVRTVFQFNGTTVLTSSLIAGEFLVGGEFGHVTTLPLHSPALVPRSQFSFDVVLLQIVLVA